MRILLALIYLVLAFSCQNNANPFSEDRQKLDEAQSKNSDSTLSEKEKYYFENTKIEFGQPIALKSTKNIAIPIILEQKYVDKDMPSNSYFNIAIIDTNNTIKKMLFEKSVVIEGVMTFEKQIDFEGYSDSDENEKKYSTEYNSLIFFNLCHYENRKKGYNRFCVYDLENDTLVQLSPVNGNVVHWRAFDDRLKIIIYYQFDSDKNGIFDEKDDENMVIVNPRKTSETKGLFDLENLKKVKVQVAKRN